MLKFDVFIWFARLLSVAVVWAAVGDLFAQSGAASLYDVTHLAGGPAGAGTTDGPGLQARFNTPTGIWGNGGILYIADSLGRSIRRLETATANVTTIAALDNLSCTATSARSVSTLLTLWADAAHAYVGDSCLHVVYKVAIDSGQAVVLAGQLQKIGSAEGPGAQALFTSPIVMWGDDVWLYVRDGARVLRIDKESGDVALAFTGFANVIDIDQTYLYTVQNAAGGAVLQSVRTSTGETKSIATLPTVQSFFGMNPVWRRTEGNEDFLYMLTVEDTIRRIRVATGEFTTFAGGIGTPLGAIGGWKDGPGSTAQFYGLISMWGDDEYLYVVEARNHTVRKIRFNTAEVSTVAGAPAVMGFVDGPAQQARFTSPGYLWGDGNYLYVTESSGTIRRVRISDGEVSTFAGTSSLPIYQESEADGIGLTARFNLPFGIWGDGVYLYVVDRRGYTLRRIAIDTGQVTTIAGSAGVSAMVDGVGAAARFKLPSGIWGDGNFLYINDDVTVRRLNLSTLELQTIAGSPGVFPPQDGIGTAAAFGQPAGIWGDGANLYIIDADTIRKIELSSARVTTLAGAFFQIASVDGIGSAARFSVPAGIWGDGSFLYIADSLGPTIRRLRPDTGETITIAGTAEKAGADDGRGTAAKFSRPQGIWGDGTDIYVADAVNYAIRRLSPARQGHEPVLVSVSPRKVTPGTMAELTITGTNFVPGESSVSVNGPGVQITNTTVQNSTSILIALDVAPDARIGARTVRVSQASGTSNPLSFEVGERPDFTTVSFSVSGRGSFSATTVEQPGAPSAGYARIETAAGAQALSGLAIYGYRAGGVLVSEAAVPAVGLIQSGRIIFDCRGATRTGIAIANPNDFPVRINYVMVGLDGAQFWQGTLDFAANQQLARFVNEFPFWGGRAEIAGTFTFTSSAAISVIALRGFTNERSEFLVSTLPVTDLTAGADRPVVFPQLADGGGWTSQILLVNPTDGPIAGRLEFVSATGSALSLTIGGQSGSRLDYSIPGRASTAFLTSGDTASVRTGWIRVSPAAGNPYPSGAVIFSFRRDGIVVTEAAVPAVAISSAFRLYVDGAGDFYAGKPGSIRTGFAIANPGSAAADVTFELTSSNGNSAGALIRRSIPANSQFSMFLDQLPGFETLPLPFKGLLRVSTTAVPGISMIGLRGRYNERNDFLISTAQPVNESASAVSPLFFPHFVQSGGYTTEFVLFPAQANSAAGSIRFFSQAGQPFNLPVR